MKKIFICFICRAFTKFETCARGIAAGCPALLGQLEQSFTAARAQFGGICGGEIRYVIYTESLIVAIERTTLFLQQFI